MAYTPKIPTLDEARGLINTGKFPYYHPCCKCKRGCSTPTKDFWNKRLKEYKTIENLYESFECRGCRKGGKAQKVSAAISVVRADNIIKRPTIKPGDKVVVPKGCIGFSTWERGIFQGTSFYSL